MKHVQNLWYIKIPTNRIEENIWDENKPLAIIIEKITIVT